jgi:hypothetical protein
MPFVLDDSVSFALAGTVRAWDLINRWLWPIWVVTLLRQPWSP